MSKNPVDEVNRYVVVNQVNVEGLLLIQVEVAQRLI
jgi:hypothetical protein